MVIWLYFIQRSPCLKRKYFFIHLRQASYLKVATGLGQLCIIFCEKSFKNVLLPTPEGFSMSWRDTYYLVLLRSTFVSVKSLLFVSPLFGTQLSQYDSCLLFFHFWGNFLSTENIHLNVTHLHLLSIMIYSRSFPLRTVLCFSIGRVLSILSWLSAS